MSQLNIVIGTPSGRGQLFGGMVGSLMALVEGLRESGIMTRFVCIEAADLIYARSTIATMVAHRKEYSHLLFIDDDMTFSLDAILDLLRADKPLIGCICPKRTIDLQKLYDGAKPACPSSWRWRNHLSSSPSISRIAPSRSATGSALSAASAWRSRSSAAIASPP